MKKKPFKLFRMNEFEVIATRSWEEAYEYMTELAGCDRDEVSGPECEMSKDELRKHKILFPIHMMPSRKQRFTRVDGKFEGDECMRIPFLKALKYDLIRTRLVKEEPFIFCSTEY